MKKTCSLILLLLAATVAHAGDMYRCATESGVLYQATPCGGEKISFSGGALISEGSKLQETAAAEAVTGTGSNAKPARPIAARLKTKAQPEQRTIEWALGLYNAAANKARTCQQSLQNGSIKPCIEFASFTQSNSDFMQAYEYLTRYDSAGLENLLQPAELDGLAKDSADILAIADQLEKMIQLAQ